MSKQKDKGRRFENQVADYLTSMGIHSERIPLSGSFGGKYDCDVVVGTPEDAKYKIECKFRENISQQLWEWIDGNDFTAIKRSRREPLIIMRMDDFARLLKKDTVNIGDNVFIGDE